MRLVVFGCSGSYGQGLKDSFKDKYLPGPLPSESAWPSIVAKTLNITVLNNSVPGTSNLQILLDVLKFDFQPDDIVAVQWTWYPRSMVFSDDKKIINLAPWMAADAPTDGKTIEQGLEVQKDLLEYMSRESGVSARDFKSLSKKFYETHGDYHLQVVSWMYVHYAFLYLDSKKIKNFFIAYDDDWEHKSNIVGAKLDAEDSKAMQVDFALDSMHPGPDTHRIWAEKFIELIKLKGYI